MSSWIVGAAANLAIFTGYLAISIAIAVGLARSKQWRANPLGVATAAIFFASAIHHGFRPAYMLLPFAGVEERTGHAMRTFYEDWQTSSWDVLTAVVGLWYWTLRSRFPALVRGAAVFEDIHQRQRQALQINDDVVQGLATARYALDAGDERRAREAIDVTLASARSIMTELLGPVGGERPIEPGRLRRGRPATVTGGRGG
jgi:hypothetical protein